MKNPSPDDHGHLPNGEADSGSGALFWRREQEIAKISEIARNTPTIRRHRVEALRRAVAAGTYTVSGQEVAAKILQRIREDFQRI